MPAIIKPSRIAAALAVEPTDGGGVTTISAFLLFDFADNRSFLTDQALWPMVAEQMPKGAIFDKAQLKPKSEWFVVGAAMAPTDEPVTGMRVHIRVGAMEKRLAVFGDRWWRLTERGLTMTQAVPFLAMPIDGARAFGGPGCKPNPKGRGHAARKILEGGYDAPLPNVEYADRLIRSPDDNPLPAGIGPMPPEAPQRLRHAGTYDQNWLRHRAPLKPEDFNPLFHCDAPDDQCLDGYFVGDESFAVSGMTHGTGLAAGQLPNVRLRTFVHRPADDSLTETRMVADTLTLFPNITKATLAYRGLAKGTDPLGDDIGTVMFALEHAEDAPRPADYYLRIFRLRKDPVEAPRHALSDFELMPETDRGKLSARRAAKLQTAREERLRFLDNQNWAARKFVQDQGMSPDIVPPVDYTSGDDLPLVAQPTPDELARGDVDIAELLDDVKALETALRLRADRELASAELHRRAIAGSAPTGLLPQVALRPLVDEAHMARFPELALDDDIAAAFDALKTNTSQVAARIAGSPSEPVGDRFAELPGEIGAIIAGLSAAREVSPEQLEKQYQAAVARALGLPEGSIFHDARLSLAGISFSGPAAPASLDAKDPVDQHFSDLFGGLGEIDLPTSPPAVPNKGLFPTDEIKTDVGLTESAIASAAKLIQQRFAHLAGDSGDGDAITGLQAKIADMAPPKPDLAGKTVGVVLREKQEDVQQRLETAEQEYGAAMISARTMSPMAIFPTEPMAAQAAMRLGDFIKQRLFAGHDFKGADLSGANLRDADFSNLDLAGTFFEQADLTQANFAGANLEGAVFTQAILDGANLADTRLSRANLSRASLKVAVLDRSQIVGSMMLEADFSGASLRDISLSNTRLIDCIFDDADLSGAEIADLQWIKGSADRLLAEKTSFARVSVTIMSMTGASFSGSRFDRVAFAEVQAEGADFAGAHMNSVSFLGNSSLRGGRFAGIDAKDSSWNTTTLDESCFLRARCEACLFNDCAFNDADLRLASFRNCRFDKSSMRESDLFAANLFGASLASVDLRLASLRGANLYAANLMQTKLASADLSGANLGKTMLETVHG